MKVKQLWRYPVKSMAGERIQHTTVSASGVVGDRAWALRQNGNTRNAKRFPGLMALRAHYEAEPAPGNLPAPVITLEDGSAFRADDADAAARVSKIVGADVEIASVAPADHLDFYRRRERSTLDESRAIFGLIEGEPFPDVSGFPESVREFSTPPGTFFDCFPILIMTTSSLAALQAAAPQSAIDVRRFRPNILVESEEPGFIENAWQGRYLNIGSARFELALPCPRCVMTTVGFHDLPRDTSIMRTLVKAVSQKFGIYANVSTGGVITEGDEAILE
ncbi:MAG TPA: MOSC N-terminal beta barrel domain-containing protein [Pseudomonadales bacterium]|nr:MOSC N-terminal beta barrel domain-containing protein [Pseudomonadales bacterium]